MSRSYIEITESAALTIIGFLSCIDLDKHGEIWSGDAGPLKEEVPRLISFLKRSIERTSGLNSILSEKDKTLIPISYGNTVFAIHLIIKLVKELEGK